MILIPGVANRSLHSLTLALSFLVFLDGSDEGTHFQVRGLGVFPWPGLCSLEDSSNIQQQVVLLVPFLGWSD